MYGFILVWNNETNQEGSDLKDLYQVNQFLNKGFSVWRAKIYCSAVCETWQLLAGYCHSQDAKETLAPNVFLITKGKCEMENLDYYSKTVAMV